MREPPPRIFSISTKRATMATFKISEGQCSCQDLRTKKRDDVTLSSFHSITMCSELVWVHFAYRPNSKDSRNPNFCVGCFELIISKVFATASKMGKKYFIFAIFFAEPSFAYGGSACTVCAQCRRGRGLAHLVCRRQLCSRHATRCLNFAISSDKPAILDSKAAHRQPLLVPLPPLPPFNPQHSTAALVH